MCVQKGLPTHETRVRVSPGSCCQECGFLILSAWEWRSQRATPLVSAWKPSHEAIYIAYNWRRLSQKWKWSKNDIYYFYVTHCFSYTLSGGLSKISPKFMHDNSSYSKFRKKFNQNYLLLSNCLAGMAFTFKVQWLNRSLCYRPVIFISLISFIITIIVVIKVSIFDWFFIIFLSGRYAVFVSVCIQPLNFT